MCFVTTCSFQKIVFDHLTDPSFSLLANVFVFVLRTDNCQDNVSISRLEFGAFCCQVAAFLKLVLALLTFSLRNICSPNVPSRSFFNTVIGYLQEAEGKSFYFC